MNKLLLRFILSIIVGLAFITISTSCEEAQAKEIARLMAANDALQTQLDSANWKLAKIDSIQQEMFEFSDSTIKAQRLQITGLTNQVLDLQGQVYVLETQVTAKNQIIADQDNTIAAQAAELVTKNDLIDELNLTITNQDATINSQIAQISSLTQQLATANALIAQKDSTIDAQTLEIAGLNGQVQSLQDEIFRLQNDLDSLLIRINNDLVVNIDSVYARIKRNGDALIIR